MGGRRDLRLLVMAAAVLLSSCTSGPLATDVAGIDGGPPEAASDQGSPTGPLAVSIDFGDGRSMTIDEEARTVALSTGEWLSMDGEMADFLFAEFQGAILSDSTWLDLFESAVQSDPYGQCGQGGQCPELRIGPPPSRGRVGSIRYRLSSLPPQVLGRGARLGLPGGMNGRVQALSPSPRQSPSGGDHLGSLAESVVIRDLGVRSDLHGLGHYATGSWSPADLRTYLTQNSTCDALRSDIYGASYAYGRMSWREAMWALITNAVAGHGVGAVLSRYGANPSLVGLAYNAVDISAAYAEERVNLAVLRGLWAIANCGHQPVVERALPWPTPGGGGWSETDKNNWTWHCVRYTYEVSYDGGLTWYPQSSVVICTRMRE